MQLRDAVERQEQRIAELERNIESERYRREVAESVLEDPQLMHQLNVEIERLQSALSDRERELEEIAAQAEAGGEPAAAAAAPETNGTDPEQLSELEGKIAVYEIELIELRARLEDVVDREFADLREAEFKEEIERLSAALASAGDPAVVEAIADEQLAPLREALAAAQDARDQATERATALAARVDALEAEVSAGGAPDPEELLAPLRAELAAAQAEAEHAATRVEALESERAERAEQETELNAEIARLNAELATAAGAPDAEELLAPVRAELAAAQADLQERAQRERELAARADDLEREHAEHEAELKGEIERLAAEVAEAAAAPDPEELLAPVRAELSAAQAEARERPSARASWSRRSRKCASRSAGSSATRRARCAEGAGDLVARGRSARRGVRGRAGRAARGGRPARRRARAGAREPRGSPFAGRGLGRDGQAHRGAGAARRAARGLRARGRCRARGRPGRAGTAE